MTKLYFKFIFLIGCFIFYANPISAQSLLDAQSHPKFKNELPVPNRIDASSRAGLHMEMNQTVQWLGLEDANGNPLMTTVWGYGPLGGPVSYPGPTFEAKKDVTTYITWHNNLPGTGHILPVDYSLHMAHPEGIDAQTFYQSGKVPVVTHLHGGHSESASDGLPEAWYTQGLSEVGPHYVKNNFTYHNDQEAATLWYHDHALGITRLNVYAGLAGFYLLSDDNEKQLIRNNVLPKGPHQLEIVLQDRQFYDNGQLFLPSETGDPWFGDPDEPLELPFSPSIVAEFFGDFIVVNGMAWPHYRVEARKYRFRLLNGSDSRFYVLEFDNNMEFLQIGTDNGFLHKPVKLDRLVIAPGERADVIVDFTGYEDTNIVLKNLGPDEPFRGLNPDGDLNDGEGGILDPADPQSSGLIMEFRVNKKLKTNKAFPSVTIDEYTILRPEITPLIQTGATRKLALFEGEDSDGRLQPLLGIINGDNAKGVNGVTNGSLGWFEEITENPMLNDVEVWEIYNATEDAHPIHLHLVSFQIVERRPFEAIVNSQDQIQHDGSIGTGGYIEESSIVFVGQPELPAANEAGWKDTFVVPPGYMGKIIAKFDRPGRYVWHCHILSHEDHEMMRPYYVGPAMFTAQQTNFVSLSQNVPNPFTTETNIGFSLIKRDQVQINIYDSKGRIILTLVNDTFPSGNHSITWNGEDYKGRIVKPGIYYYKIVSGKYTETKRLYFSD